MGLDEFAQGNAHFLFYIARALHMAGDAENLDAAVVGTPQPGKPGSAAAQNLRHHGDGLDIVDGGWRTVEADIGGEGRF